MKYKALALDLDGTLTNSDKELSEENKRAIFEAIEQDATVILASGRPLFGITPIADELELQDRGGYILAYNGGNIIDCKTGKSLYSCLLPKKCMSDICRLAHETNTYALTYFGDQIVAESDTDEYVLKEAKCNAAQIKKVDSLEEFVDYQVPKFLVVGKHEDLLPVQTQLLELHSDCINAFFSEDYFLEVVPKDVAKDVALAELLGQLGIHQKELIACGDGMNDIPMLRYAGLGVAMENAYPEVKKHADWIAPSNDQDGVAYTITKYITSVEA